MQTGAYTKTLILWALEKRHTGMLILSDTRRRTEQKFGAYPLKARGYPWIRASNPCPRSTPTFYALYPRPRPTPWIHALDPWGLIRNKETVTTTPLDFALFQVTQISPLSVDLFQAPSQFLSGSHEQLAGW